jgi:hypothetical protein
MRHLTLASASFDKHSKQARRGKFLVEMDQVVQWRELCALIAPFYSKAGRPNVLLQIGFRGLNQNSRGGYSDARLS